MHDCKYQKNLFTHFLATAIKNSVECFLCSVNPGTKVKSFGPQFKKKEKKDNILFNRSVNNGNVN